MRFIAFLLAFSASIAQSVPLTSSQTYGAQHTDFFRNGTPGMIMAKGIGDNNAYMIEVDPVTGEIPVSASVTFSNDTNYGVVGANTLRTAAQIGNATGAASFGAGTTGAQVLRVVLPTDQSSIPAAQSGTWNITNISGTVSLPTGAATVAKQPALGTAGTASADVITVQGITSMTPLLVNGSGSTQPVSGTVAATQSGVWTVQPGNTANTTAWKVDGSAVTQPVSGTVAVSSVGGTVTVAGTVAASNFPATVDTNAGVVGASTVRVSEASRTYSDSVRNDYSSVNVTTGAWVQLIASTAAAINLLCITDQSGQIMELGTGAALSETRVFLISRGFSGCIPLRIAASTRISVRAVSATASTGDITLSGMN